MSENDDWLEQLDNTGMVQPEQRVAAVAFAQNYLVFSDDSRGRALLEHWKETLGCKRLPPTASLQEFAYAEAQRAFIQGIEEQLRFALTNR